VLRLSASRGVRTRRSFEPQDPDYESRIRASFARQTFMTTIGARLSRVAPPGEVDIELAVRDPRAATRVSARRRARVGRRQRVRLRGVQLDAAGRRGAERRVQDQPARARGSAIASLRWPRHSGWKDGQRLLGEVTAYAGASERLVATMVATMMTVRDRG
jgi:acyl-coenzyme A thioesterase PaaI-like protein